MKAVFLDAEGLTDRTMDALENECSSFALFPTTRPGETAERIAGAELIIINKVKLTRQHLEAAPTVRLICLVATGTDVVDIQAARELGVTVCNCQGYGTASVVQHVFSLLLALNTSLISYHNDVQKGQWQKAKQFCLLDHPITELQGKTLGIVGYGNLGRGVALVAEAFGMRVVIARRPGSTDTSRPALREILPEVDALTLHCPLTDQTRDLIDASALQLMKPTAFLINAARGGIVDETALVQALQGGEIAGAGVDVLSLEPPKESNPLLEIKLPNLLVTPHTAWASEEARQRIIDQTTENIRAFKAGLSVRVVN